MSYSQESGHEQDHAREQITSGNLIFKLINDVQGCPYFVLELPMKASIAMLRKDTENLQYNIIRIKLWGQRKRKRKQR